MINSFILQQETSLYLSNTRVGVSNLHNNREWWHAYLKWKSVISLIALYYALHFQITILNM